MTHNLVQQFKKNNLFIQEKVCKIRSIWAEQTNKEKNGLLLDAVVLHN